MERKKFLYLNSRDELLRIDISKIIYFEAEGNYTNIVLSNRMKGTVCMNLSKMKTVLAESLREDSSVFVRVGKKYIINANYVYLIATVRQQLILSDGEHFEYKLSVSKEALKELRELFITGKISPR